jgi:hypothetical protein
MASIDSIVNEFIAENELSSDIKLPLQGLVNKCFEGVFKHIYNAPIPETGASKPKAQKVLKADKIEDPATCESREDLLHCTTASLAAYCKARNLKSAGNKTEVIDRVWRDLQGTGSEEDKSVRLKAKATKKVVEKHQCSGCNAKGEKCAVVGTECFPETDYWFCWRHITEAEEFIAKLEDPNQPKPKDRVPKASKAEKPKEKSKTKSKAKSKELEVEDDSDAETEPVKSTKVKKSKSKPKVESESESEPEPKPKSKSKSKPKVETESESEPEPKPKPKKKIPQPVVLSESEVESESDDEDQDSEAERNEHFARLARAEFEKSLREFEEEQ